MWKYIVVVGAHISWMFNFLLYHSFNKRYDQYFDDLLADQSQTTESLRAVPYHEANLAGANESGVECAVCLCKIEEGEEVRELRCAHLFHKLCLDRWTALNHATCPLCRSRLAPPRSTEISDQFYPRQLEVLLFKFCSFSSDSDHINQRDSWWLR